MSRTSLILTSIMLVGALSAGCTGPGFNLPHPDRLAHPGPGVSGPGPGVLSPEEMMGGAGGRFPNAAQLCVDGQPGGVSTAGCFGSGCGCGGDCGVDCGCGPDCGCIDGGSIDAGIVGGIPTVQVLFTKPGGMRVAENVGQ